MGNDRRKSSSSRREEKGYENRDRRDDRTKNYDRKDKYRDIERDRYRTKDQDLSRERYIEEHHVPGRDRNDKESTRARENELKKKGESAAAGSQLSTSQIAEDMKEQRLKRKSESVSEVLSWVHKSRKLEERRYSEKEKAVQLEQEKGDDVPARHTSKDLAGVKVLHGLDKVAEGGAVVLTLKDQSILAGGDLNEENDMLENVEFGEQKRRDDAHKAAKKRTGKYEDMFDDGTMPAKKILPQYDDPVEDEGVTFDESGRLGDTEKKLEDLHKRPFGVSSTSRLESLVTPVKIPSDYYTQEEMLRINKPKKQKSLGKKDKLDLDALELEAISAGLGVGDRGSRKDGKLQSDKEEQLRSEAQKRSDAYKSAIVRAEEACKALRHEQVSTFPVNEAENLVFGDEDDDLYKSIEKARKLALRKQNVATAAQAAASAITASNKSLENQTTEAEVTQDDKIVFTETERFVWGFRSDKEAHKPEDEDFIMEEDEIVKSSDQEIKEFDADGLIDAEDANENGRLVTMENEKKEDTTLAAIFHEPAVDKGLGSMLQLLRERGTLGETAEPDDRNTDKKENKQVGIHGDSKPKEIRIDRRDEFGRIMTPAEAYRVLCHNFHGKFPVKKKREKFIKKYLDEMKLKQKPILR
ncbi:hypothetical protein C5167_040081 [Papaver somniferum]|uniref:SART-1 family protein n=1 Tax=Papaver somniferum TaxID=3469 RepID=A0A4Y7II79_PAPSO|nr:hypothetical protein C5167_040081 [Papaver somniferum]